MANDGIFPAEDALVISMVLMHAADRMPGITDAERAAVLEVARIMSAHGCDTVIAGVVTDRSMARASGRPSG